MGSTETTFKDYSIQIPTKVMDAGTKEIQFEYIVDEKWANYRSLYTWMSGIEGNINPIDKTSSENIGKNYMLDVRVWLIDNFKLRLIDLVFHNSWIHMFNDLALESGNTDEVIHGFSMYYSNFEIMNAKQ